jgi:hypothetical protein
VDVCLAGYESPGQLPDGFAGRLSTGLRELARDELFQQRTRHIVKDLIQDSIEIALHGDRARAPASRVKERANRSEHTTGVGAEAACDDLSVKPAWRHF